MSALDYDGVDEMEEDEVGKGRLVPEDPTEVVEMSSVGPLLVRADIRGVDIRVDMNDFPPDLRGIVPVTCEMLTLGSRGCKKLTPGERDPHVSMNDSLAFTFPEQVILGPAGDYFKVEVGGPGHLVLWPQRHSLVCQRGVGYVGAVGVDTSWLGIAVPSDWVTCAFCKRCEIPDDWESKGEDSDLPPWQDNRLSHVKPGIVMQRQEFYRQASGGPIVRFVLSASSASDLQTKHHDLFSSGKMPEFATIDGGVMGIVKKHGLEVDTLNDVLSREDAQAWFRSMLYGTNLESSTMLRISTALAGPRRVMVMILKGPEVEFSFLISTLHYKAKSSSQQDLIDGHKRFFLAYVASKSPTVVLEIDKIVGKEKIVNVVLTTSVTGEELRDVENQRMVREWVKGGSELNMSFKVTLDAKDNDPSRKIENLLEGGYEPLYEVQWRPRNMSPGSIYYSHTGEVHAGQKVLVGRFVVVVKVENGNVHCLNLAGLNTHKDPGTLDQYTQVEGFTYILHGERRVLKRTGMVHTDVTTECPEAQNFIGALIKSGETSGLDDTGFEGIPWAHMVVGMASLFKEVDPQRYTPYGVLSDFATVVSGGSLDLRYNSMGGKGLLDPAYTSKNVDRTGVRKHGKNPDGTVKFRPYTYPDGIHNSANFVVGMDRRILFSNGAKNPLHAIGWDPMSLYGAGPDFLATAENLGENLTAGARKRDEQDSDYNPGDAEHAEDSESEDSDSEEEDEESDSEEEAEEEAEEESEEEAEGDSESPSTDPPSPPDLHVRKRAKIYHLLGELAKLTKELSPAELKAAGITVSK